MKDSGQIVRDGPKDATRRTISSAFLCSTYREKQQLKLVQKWSPFNKINCDMNDGQTVVSGHIC